VLVMFLEGPPTGRTFHWIQSLVPKTPSTSEALEGWPANMEAMKYEAHAKYFEPRMEHPADSEHAQIRLGIHP